MKDSHVKPPSRKQLIALRSMILIGLICMVFFIGSLLKDTVIGYRPLYFLLLSTFLFTFFKIAYEWYHYWSISIPAVPPITRAYTVDVFTTFCAGEPYEMIVETLTAMQAITYPHESFLCDEANDAYLKSVCQSLGVHYVTRTDKRDAKAGNINNALRQSTGELCVILDPDHIPVPEFLDPIVSHFDNPEVGYVQIVQAYYNQDVSWVAKGAAQQTYQFYGPMMMCMNSYGTVQAIGANCTFRRTALDSIGGHAAGLAEDMHTAMQLHAQKWKSVYVPRVLTKGLVPATLSAYYKQQLKWSRGVFELLVTTYIKLFTKLNWRQKLHYGLLPFFYFSGFVFAINFAIPVIALATGTFPLRIDFSEFLIISIPFISAVILIRHYVQQWVMEDDERGFHLIGGLLLIGTWWIFILGIVYTIIRKNVPYIATPKDVKQERNLRINLPNITVLMVSVLAIVYGLYKDWNPFSLFMAGIVSLNCFFMAFILIASSELKMQGHMNAKNHISRFNLQIKRIKRRFWLFRRKIYSGVRRISLLLIVLIVCLSIYASKYAGERFGDQAQSIQVYHVDPELITNPVASSNEKERVILIPSYFGSVKGVVYSKGSSWYKNLYPLTKKIIIKDFAEMKVTGINSVKIFGPNIYDHSIIDIARENDIDIYYSFLMPPPSYFGNNDEDLEKFSQDILSTVNKLKSNSNIKSWNFGGDTFHELNKYYQKEQLEHAKYNCINWLNELSRQIKIADKNRKITLDLVASSSLKENLNLLHREIPVLDAFGLVIKQKYAFKNISADMDAPYFISDIDPRLLVDAELPAGGVFLANWQDQQSADAVTFDGLKDIWGHNKPSIYQIGESWGGAVPRNSLPSVKILKPAITAFPGTSLVYHALVYLHDDWNLASVLPAGMQFEWYIVKTDKWGNAMMISSIGKGPVVSVTAPDKLDQYRIYLLATKGNNSVNDYTTLNTPLKN
jgi:cellulose synthase (UDP-forming)